MFVSVLLLHYFISMCVVVFRDVWNSFFISDWFRFSFLKKSLIWFGMSFVQFGSKNAVRMTLISLTLLTRRTTSKYCNCILKSMC